MSNEIWAPILETCGKYEVSTMGRVRRAATQQCLRPKKHVAGYASVNLKRPGGTVLTRLVHRLVALTFLPRELRREMVDHIDGNRTNNQLSNLRFATLSQNSMNRRINNSTTGVKGVQRLRNGRYSAVIGVNRKRIFLGYYNDLEEATRVITEARRRWHGDYASY